MDPLGVRLCSNCPIQGYLDRYGQACRVIMFSKGFVLAWENLSPILIFSAIVTELENVFWGPYFRIAGPHIER